MDNTTRMPSLPEVVVGVEGGFVGVADVLDEMLRTGSAAAVVGGSRGGVALDVALSTGTALAAADAIPHVAGGGRAMRWNNNTSGFVLRRMAQLVGDGSRPDKVFKYKDVNHVAKALKEYCGEVVSPTQVYNHLRKWRQKRARVARLKDLSGALWDSDTNAIMLDEEHYLGHCKVVTNDMLHMSPYLACIHYLSYNYSFST